MVIECRLDGSLAIRFQTRYLPYREAASKGELAEQKREEVAPAAKQASEETVKASSSAENAAKEKPSGASDGAEKGDKGKGPRKPAADHPWRKPFKNEK